MSVLTLTLCARLGWLLVSFQVHIKSLHIIIIIIIIILLPPLPPLPSLGLFENLTVVGLSLNETAAKLYTV